MHDADGRALFRGVGLEVTTENSYNSVARALYERMGYRDSGFGEFISGYTFWDADGEPHRDDELYCYLTKRLGGP